MTMQPHPASATDQARPSNLAGSLLVACCLVAALVYFYIPRSMADPDIGWHLRDAQIQLSTHSFLTRDLFSFTAAGSTWMDHEWLSELPFYAAFHLFGNSGVYFVTLLTVEVIFLSLFYLIYFQSTSILSSLLTTILAILISTVSFGPRTLLFGWVLLVIELIILTHTARRKALIWILPFLFAIWVNTHGSWLIGIILFAFFVIASAINISVGCIENSAATREETKLLALCWITSVAALFLNPYGWRLVLYPFDLAFRQTLNVANVDEWKTLDFHSPRGRILFACLLLVFFFQLLRNRKWTLFELAIAAMGLYSAFTYSRFLFLAAILFMPSLAKSFASRPAAQRRSLSPLVGGALLFLVVCAVIGKLRTPDQVTTTNDPRYPNKALPFLDNFHPDGNVFNEYTWGGFLIWHEHRIPVFVDSRVDIFEYNGTFKDYLDIVHLTNSIALLNKHQIKYVLFQPNSQLVTLLQATHDWKVDYQDDTTILLERINPQKAAN